ncbi:putative NRPS-like protein biosynthetic cluster [Tephrocybe rancida]|nr:putative NRPS-like protein biosynthetic cluster [Tephrocybe rancida]
MAGSTPLTVLPTIENLFIPDAIDFNIKNNPEHPFFTFADSEAPNGIQVVTHLEFGRAAHRIAHALRPNRAGPDGQVVAIIVLSDTILYQAIVVGCIIAGLVPFPISPRNSPAAVVNLLEKTSCHRIITTNVTLKALIDGIRSQISGTPLLDLLQVEEAPSLATAYPNLGHETPEHSFERFPSPSQPLSRDDLCIYLHSSGSTGFPKAIPQTHLAWMHWSLFPGVVDFRDARHELIMGCMALPPFHTLGLYMQVLNPIYGLVSITVYPPTAPTPESLPVQPSPQNILDHTRLTKSTAIIIIPTLLQIWSMSPESVKFLASLAYVGYSGGSLAPRLGNILVGAGVSLHPVYGGTEFGAPTHPMSHKGEERDWEYMRFQDRANVRWVSQGDGTFECQFLAWEHHQPMVLNLPDVEGYATSDLFANHPTKKDLWKIVGRIDDVIVHSSGEKTVPAPMEDIIMSSPLVQGAIIFGRERDQTGILIEPKPGNAIDLSSNTELASLRNKIWPIIEEANKVAPAFSRIFKEMILITSDAKPLPRTGKGTVMRKAALATYNEEIAALYDTVESNIKTAENVAPPASWALSDVQAWIVDQATELVSGSELSPLVDLFDQGFDSLSATFLRLRIIGALRASEDSSVKQAAQGLNQNLVYSYPVIRDLAAHIVSLLTCPGDVQEDAASRRTSLIEEMIEKYSFGLLGSPPNAQPQRPSPTIVLLTGSTGNLGSEILAALLRDARVEHVYAFNRPSQGSLTVEQRHLSRFEERGFDTSLLNTGKVSYISGDATQADLGLDRGQFSQLSRSVNIVIHNAWKLDFNLSLSAFESNIQGTRHFIDFLKSGPNAGEARFLFTSSVTSAQSWPRSKGPYPEEILTDPSFAVGGGYGEGKYVTERILAKSGLQAMSLRIGQISGGQPKGAWAITDWVPILVKSSATMGSLPDIRGGSTKVVSWIPMDAAAGAVVDAALGNEALPQAVNLVHPQPAEGIDVINSIQAAISEVLGRRLKVVPFAEWLATLEKHAESATAETLAQIPAIKLLDFFRSISQGNDDIIASNGRGREAGGLPAFSTQKMLQVSHNTMSELQSLGREDASLWVKYWQDIEFLR